MRTDKKAWGKDSDLSYPNIRKVLSLYLLQLLKQYPQEDLRALCNHALPLIKDNLDYWEIDPAEQSFLLDIDTYTARKIGFKRVKSFLDKASTDPNRIYVYFTVSLFADPVKDFVKHMNKTLILIDGEQLADLLLTITVSATNPFCAKEIPRDLSKTILQYCNSPLILPLQNSSNTQSS